MKIHTGDTILVISGKDKGKVGSVLRVLEGRVVVSDVNLRTRHIRKTAQGPGQRIRYEASIAVSNLMLIDPKTKKPTRIGMRVDAKGHKVRFAKVSGEVIVVGVKAKTQKKTKAKGEEAEKKVEKAAKKEEIAKVEGPKRSPFWKRMSFGAEALEETGDKAEAKPDHSIAEQNKTPEKFSHGRGS